MSRSRTFVTFVPAACDTISGLAVRAWGFLRRGRRRRERVAPLGAGLELHQVIHPRARRLALAHVPTSTSPLTFAQPAVVPAWVKGDDDGTSSICSTGSLGAELQMLEARGSDKHFLPGPALFVGSLPTASAAVQQVRSQSSSSSSRRRSREKTGLSQALLPGSVRSSLSRAATNPMQAQRFSALGGGKREEAEDEEEKGDSCGYLKPGMYLAPHFAGSVSSLASLEAVMKEASELLESSSAFVQVEDSDGEEVEHSPTLLADSCATPSSVQAGAGAGAGSGSAQGDSRLLLAARQRSKSQGNPHGHASAPSASPSPSRGV